MSLTAQDRYQFREIKVAVDDAELSGQESVRKYRNVLSIAVLALTAAAIFFPTFARHFSPDILTIRLAPASDGPSVIPTPIPSASPTSSPTSSAASSSGSAQSDVPAATDAASDAASAQETTPVPATGVTSEPATLGSDPSTGQVQPDLRLSFGDLATIEGWGALGGLITASISLPRIRSSRDPAGLHLAQLALKLPAGALTGLFGIVLMQSSILNSLAPAQSGQLAAYAVLFGFTQIAFTRFVDKQSDKILDSARTVTDKGS